MCWHAIEELGRDHRCVCHTSARPDQRRTRAATNQDATNLVRALAIHLSRSPGGPSSTAHALAIHLAINHIRPPSTSPHPDPGPDPTLTLGRIKQTIGAIKEHMKEKHAKLGDKGVPPGKKRRVAAQGTNWSQVSVLALILVLARPPSLILAQPQPHTLAPRQPSLLP